MPAQGDQLWEAKRRSRARQHDPRMSCLSRELCWAQTPRPMLRDSVVSLDPIHSWRSDVASTQKRGSVSALLNTYSTPFRKWLVAEREATVAIRRRDREIFNIARRFYD